VDSLKRARHAKGISLTQLAKMTGLHEVSIARAERIGQDVKVSTVVAIARALKVPVCELIDEGEPHERHERRSRRRRG
jgi:transcriptional regulator with XRE-family HTH domain